MTCWGTKLSRLISCIVRSVVKSNKLLTGSKIIENLYEELEHVIMMLLFRLSIEYKEEEFGPINALELRGYVQPFFRFFSFSNPPAQAENSRFPTIERCSAENTEKGANTLLPEYCQRH